MHSSSPTTMHPGMKPDRGKERRPSVASGQLLWSLSSADKSELLDGPVAAIGAAGRARQGMVNGLNDIGAPGRCGVLRTGIRKQTETKLFAFWPEF